MFNINADVQPNNTIDSGIAANNGVA